MRIETLKAEQLLKVFRKYAISAAYLFGSAANGNERKDSDIDVAILLPADLSKKMRFEIRLALMHDLARVLDKNVDVVILNDIISLFFKYVIIKEGVLLYEKNESERIDFENRILSSYFDFQPFLNLYNRQYVKNNL
ncbi:nucleotidyltransferase domain-containing protein [Candidatus Peregrinibacteria bacterium]|nr:nucleotidyltransferase domain-containing protein [Candidatus Peregrinibacteria bacterium]